MPWQRQVAEVATEQDHDGVPFWREVFVTTPRQAGKSSLILLLLLERCLTWGRPQSCVWTGQDGMSIRRKWLHEIVPWLERSEVAPLVSSVRRANGTEAVEFYNGSRIDLLPTSETAGHGMVIDFAVLDEIFADHDNRREAALLPAMATKRDAQMLTCSTAGTGASTVFNRKVKGGRVAVAEDREDGMAYFEWSAPDDWDPHDDDSFSTFHPAVGHTIDMSVIRQARDTFADEPDEFARAYGNRPVLDGGSVFAPHVWGRVVQNVSADPATVAAVGVDVTYERDAAAVAVIDGDGTVELAEYRAGLSWLVPYVERLADATGAPVLFDGRGPAGAVDGLKDVAGARPLPNLEVVAACGQFFDAVQDRGLTVRRDPVLERAVSGVEIKHVGDAFVWSRRASRHDVTPLYAVTLALAGARQPVAGLPAGALYV